MNRKKMTLLVASILLFGALIGPAAAQYPEKPITIVVWSKPGSSPDILARNITKIGEKYVGQPMSVVTKAGGSGTIAMAHILKQKPDGYTILMASRGFPLVMAWEKDLNLKPEFFSPLCRFAVEPPMLAVNAKRPYKTWAEFVDYAKKNPNSIKVANSGLGWLHHTLFLRVKKIAGIQTLDIPYKGGRPAINSCIGGHDDAVANNPSVLKSPIEMGKLVGLYTYGEKRLNALPDVPTLKEMGIDIVEYQWRGLLIDAKVPKDRVDYLAKAFQKMTQDPQWEPLLKKFVWTPGWMWPEEFQKYIDEDIVEIKKDLVAAGLKK